MVNQKMTEFQNLFKAQQKIWKRIYDIVDNKKIGNAYIFSGSEGSGKEALAIAFGQLLNCNYKGTRPCEKCSSCIRFNKLQHESLNLIVPLPQSRTSKNEMDNSVLSILNQEINTKSADHYYKIKIPKAKRILIQSIRALRKTLYLKSEQNFRKVVLIFDAHFLSAGQAESANALLKLLEEPPSNTTLILVTDYKELLLPTIISRCQSLGVPKFSDSFIQTWLRSKKVAEEKIFLISGLSGGNIHQARFLIEQPLTDLINQLNEILRSILNKNPELWYSFINAYSRMANVKPDSFKFYFGFLTIWFQSVYRKKMGMSDPLHKTELGKKIDKFNYKYNNARLLDIVLELEDVIFAIQDNLYMPLRLTNMILNIQKLLNP
tara:strand:+ start:3628 stop:4761 length:1134 start_codon:yes stop_codon:yes gene_type:complete